jgi:hypothetical protein
VCLVGESDVVSQLSHSLLCRRIVLCFGSRGVIAAKEGTIDESVSQGTLFVDSV